MLKAFTSFALILLLPASCAPQATNPILDIQRSNIPGKEYKTTVTPTLAHWNQALANCRNQAVTVAWDADSTGTVYQGDGSGEGPSVASNRFAEQERIYLQGRCGSHGTGPVPYIKFLAPGSPNPNPQYYGPSTGTIVQDATLGPSQVFSGTTAGTMARATQNGSTINWTSVQVGLAEDHINEYCVSGAGLNPWTITINPHGSTSTTLASGTCGTTSGPNRIAVANAAFPSQIVDVHLACATAPCVHWAVEGISGTTGISLYNGSFASGMASAFLVPGAFAPMDSIVGGIDLLQIDFGTNEALTGVSASAFHDAITNIVSHAQGLSTPASVLIYMEPVCGASGCSTLPALANAALLVSQQKGTQFLSMSDALGSTAYLSGNFTDGIHPTDALALFAWDRIKSAIVDVEGSPMGSYIVSGSSIGLKVVGDASATNPGLEADASASGGGDWVHFSQYGSAMHAWVENHSGISPFALYINAAPVGGVLYSAGFLSGATMFAWSGTSNTNANTNPSAMDTSLGRSAAGQLCVGTSALSLNCDGSMNAAFIKTQYVVPISATAPSGACGPDGAYAASQDGHMSSCTAGSWISRW